VRTTANRAESGYCYSPRNTIHKGGAILLELWFADFSE
jgi:hypothetical protein